MKKEMLINVLQPEECRIAIVEDGILEELYVERSSQESYVGNIYKGRIVNIEPSIQAAFVDFGIGRNGFLHVSDVEPAYYRHLEEQQESEGRRRGRDRGRSEPQQRQSEYDVDDLMAPDEARGPLGVHEATAPEEIAVAPPTRLEPAPKTPKRSLAPSAADAVAAIRADAGGAAEASVRRARRRKEPKEAPRPIPSP